VDFVPVAEGEWARVLATGGADLAIGAIPHTREAELQADFSLTTYVAGEGLMIRAGTVVEGLGDLDGQPVAVVSGTGSADELRQAAREAGIAPVLVPKASLEEAVAALMAGEVTALAGERVALLGPAYATPGLGVTPLRLTRVPLALGLPPGDSRFRDLVNLTLQRMAQDGSFAAIYGEWFDDAPPTMEPWPGEPTGPLTLTPTAPATTAGPSAPGRPAGP